MPTGQYLRKPHTKERKEKISNSLKGRKHSLEARRNMSEAHKGKKVPKHSGHFKDEHKPWNKGNKKYTRKTKRVNNKVIPKSNLVYMEYHKLEEIPKGFVVHHIDENPLNNDITNLRMMSKAEHHFLHGALAKERHKTKLNVERLKKEIGKRVYSYEEINEQIDKIFGELGARAHLHSPQVTDSLSPEGTHARGCANCGKRIEEHIGYHCPDTSGRLFKYPKCEVRK